MIFFILNIIINYFTGSIPFAYLLVRIVSGKDIRKHGSGNSGATNVTRIIGLKYGILAFMLDFFKGFGLVYLTNYFFAYYNMQYAILYYYISIAFILTGHIFSVFLGFRGGKGAASGIGIIFALSFFSGLCVSVIWIFVFLVSRIVALATIIASLSLPFFIFFIEKKEDLIVFSIAASFFVIIKHWSNILRMIRKEENSFRR